MRSFLRRRADLRKATDSNAQADALVEGGHCLEAIDLLTAANHDKRDADTEKRLVRLRHQAFSEVDATEGLGAWPPEAPDLFPGITGVPEIAADALNVDVLRSGILRHGALIVRGLIPPARVEQLTDDIDRAFDAYQRFFDGAPPEETAPWFVPFEPEPGPTIGHIRPWVRKGGGILAVESPRAMFDVLDAFADAGLSDTLTGYLGERPVLAAKKWTLRRVPLDITADWHQDGAFLGEGIRAVNVWVTLTDCGDDSPGLDIVGGRLNELVTTGTEGAWFDWSVGDPVVRGVAGEAPILRPILQAGDAMLFDDLFLHRTAVEPEMTRERYAIEAWFFAPSHYPDAQIPVAF